MTRPGHSPGRAAVGHHARLVGQHAADVHETGRGPLPASVVGEAEAVEAVTFGATDHALAAAELAAEAGAHAAATVAAACLRVAASAKRKGGNRRYGERR